MSSLAIIFGILLNIVGLVGFFGTGATHHTALIPCVLGLLLILSGLIARKEKLRQHAMHVAVLVALLGFLGTASALGKITLLFGATADPKAAAIMAKSATAFLCLIFFILCVRSFVKARLLKKY
ncbi:MAG: hypothetical protein K2W97_00155 [Chthoniobacterales bacterium]|nr:hypothetical protein [Chthoniobacterales bacterium]